MTLSLEAKSARSGSLTTAQLAMVQHLWHIAGLSPTSGYETAVLAAAVASNQALATTLTSVDFNEADSVSNAVKTLLQWRQRTSK
jgi:hypothetical protein